VEDNWDVGIDFTHASLLKSHMNFSKPLVVGTTDLSQNDMQELLNFSKNQKVFYSPNMSLGVESLKRALKSAAQMLQNTHVPEIHELHHGLKKDAPSGTALMLAGFVKDLNLGWDQEKDYQKEPLRTSKDIGISVNRGGSGYSSHTVSLIGNSDMLEIKYHNWNPSIYAQGALEAAFFLNQLNRPLGFYTMEDLLSQ
jgi:4-hydroxy-tetrahydrodipicolinate reductase